ncbi:hypothetical protein SRABI128_05364 [Microbacterium sp. Bi128]|nr:hypothetical protein SRABI128_05364 [Microbacterium sp. Bi128]
MFAYQVPPQGLRLVTTSGGHVPKSEFTPGVIDSVAGLNMDFESHLGENFARDRSEMVSA